MGSTLQLSINAKSLCKYNYTYISYKTPQINTTTCPTRQLTNCIINTLHLTYVSYQVSPQVFFTSHKAPVVQLEHLSTVKNSSCRFGPQCSTNKLLHKVNRSSCRQHPLIESPFHSGTFAKNQHPVRYPIQLSPDSKSQEAPTKCGMYISLLLLQGHTSLTIKTVVGILITSSSISPQTLSSFVAIGFVVKDHHGLYSHQLHNCC